MRMGVPMPRCPAAIRQQILKHPNLATSGLQAAHLDSIRQYDPDCPVGCTTTEIRRMNDLLYAAWHYLYAGGPLPK